MDIIAVIIALIVPIGVAIWTVRSSAKDTAKQITALEESTTKQIESVKELARIQIEITKIQLQKELRETRSYYLQVAKKSSNAIDDHFTYLGMPYDQVVEKMHDNREKMNNLTLEQVFYSKKVAWTDNYLKRVEQLEKELENA